MLRMMAGLTYSSFDLWIGRAADGYIAKARDPHGREATVEFRLPVNELEVAGFWREMDRAQPRARRDIAPAKGNDRSRPNLAPRVDAAKKYGGALFDALFHGGLSSCFDRSLEQAVREGAGLRIRLRLTDVPELADLPWEYLYDGSSDRFFALSVTTPVVRYLELPEPPQPLTVRPPLRMLVMVSSPSDHAKLNVEQEWRRLDEALGDLQQRRLLHLEPLQGATLPALQRRLRRGAVHVLHFIGHGDFDQRSQKGALILEDESGRGLPVSAEDLGVVLHDHAPRLVVLNACEGARSSRLNPFAGVAQTLVRQGVPAVVAMQTQIRDDFALILAHELYGALADGYPVDACLAEARKVLAGQHDPAWGTPVLYLRAPDGRILDREAPADAGRPADAAGAGAVSERASPAAKLWLKWAGAAVLFSAVLLLLVFRLGRESPPIDNEPVPPEVRLPEAELTETSPTDAAPSNDDRAERSRPIEPVAGEAAASPWGDRGGRPADAPEPDSRPTAASEVSTTETVASAWPQGDHSPGRQQRSERDGMYYVWIPKGDFQFGCSPGDDLCEDDEKPASRQVLERGFWLGQTEVTVGAYKRFRDHPSMLLPAPSFNPDWQDEAQPMVSLSRADAASFCEWAGTRLPTEIEWEYAARAGERRALPPDISKSAWFDGQSKMRAHAVSQKEPNAFGLYDMLGNVSEWVAPSPDQPAEFGILRGGSWSHAAQFLRFSFRHRDASGARSEMYGFRCLADPP
jgi:formylglycine-generating enzyme required for sulfatase activity